MTSGAKASDLRGEVGAEIGVGDDVHLRLRRVRRPRLPSVEDCGVTPRAARVSR